MTKEEFVKRCHEIKKNWLDDEFNAYIEAALDRSAVNLEKVPPHYGAVYPLLAAIFEDVARQCVNGYPDLRRQANKIKPFLHCRSIYYYKK